MNFFSLRPVMSLFVGLAMFVAFVGMAYGQSPQGAQPESFTSYQTSTRTITIYLEEDDPVKAAEMMTELHDEQARNGYVLLHITPYVDGEDTEGFLLTYQLNSTN